MHDGREVNGRLLVWQWEEGEWRAHLERGDTAVGVGGVGGGGGVLYMCLTTHFLRPCGLGCQCGEGERLCELGVLVYLETDHFLDTSRHVPFIP